jgi:D-alanine-D-alanine ligase
MMTNTAQKILVLHGGSSSERAVSLRSAANVITQLDKLGHEVIIADPSHDSFNLRDMVAQVDIILPILHGAGGEDGTLQRELEALGKPFLGSGSDACDLTFDKAMYRDFVAQHGVLIADGEVVDHEQFKESEFRHGPYVLKPVSGGSSVDTIIVHNIAEEPDGLVFEDLFNRYSEMLIEELIDGQELTVGILGDEALPVILIIPPSHENFDYENKYNGRTQELVNPADVSGDVQKRAKELALRLHRLTGCRHMSRTDMIVANDMLYVLETNTIPGLTEQSLLPKAAEVSGLDRTALVKSFVDMTNSL